MTPKKRSSQNRGRGRPPLKSTEKKERHTISLTQYEWMVLKQKATSLNKSVSEFLADIARDCSDQWRKTNPSFELKFAISLEKLPKSGIFLRLKSFIQPPIVVFSSLVGFVMMVSRQLGLPDDCESVLDTLLKTNFTVFLIDYIHPHCYINNPSALLRWLSYQIMLANAEVSPPVSLEQDKRQVLEQKDMDSWINKILYSVIMLQQADFATFGFLKMKVIEDMSLPLIARIESLRTNQEISEQQIQFAIKNGLTHMRKAWAIAKSSLPSHSDVASLGFKMSINDENDNDDPVSEADKSVELKMMPLAKAYLNLAALSKLDTTSLREEMKQALDKTNNNAELDFFIHELNYHLAEKCISNFEQRVELIRESLDQKIESYILDKMRPIRENIVFAQTKTKLKF